MSQAVPAGQPGLSGLRRPELAGLRDPLHAEWTKLRTVAGPAWLLAGTIAATVAVGAAATAAETSPTFVPAGTGLPNRFSLRPKRSSSLRLHRPLATSQQP